jgi:hypothetical protein
MNMFDNWLMTNQSDDEPDFVPLFSLEEDDEKVGEVFPDILPILPLKNTVLFPGIVTPITVGRDKSIRAVQKAYEESRYIGVLSQKDVKISHLQRPVQGGHYCAYTETAENARWLHHSHTSGPQAFHAGGD